MRTPHKILYAKQSASQINTRSRLMMNRSPEVTGPRTMRAVSWNTWKKQDDLYTTQTIQAFTILARFIP